jgi:sugar O-acyltransferase (sialic acid O-acetyltransferase NeuD family)
MNVVILGAGGQGKVVLEILRAQKQYTPVGFLDADPSLTGTNVHDLPVLGPVNAMLPQLGKRKVRGAIVAIGDNRTRLSYADLLREHGLELISAIHPSAVVSPTARLGVNTVLCAGAVVCTDARIGDSVIINTAAVVDHECEIGDGAHIAPGALLAGRVRIGRGAFVGLGAKILPCLSVGEHAMIGAGAVAIRDVAAGATVVGVPARVLRAAGA